VNAFAILYEGVETNFFATDDNTASTENEPANYILVFFLGNGPLDYTYEEDPFDIEFFTVEGTYELIGGTFTITSYGEVGGVIEGTFRVTVKASFNGSETIDLENGNLDCCESQTIQMPHGEKNPYNIHKAILAIQKNESPRVRAFSLFIASCEK